jgi:hypothetical protein
MAICNSRAQKKAGTTFNKAFGFGNATKKKKKKPRKNTRRKRGLRNGALSRIS